MRHSNIAFFVPHLGCGHACSFCNQRTISGEQRAPTAEEVRMTLERAFHDIADRGNTEVAFFGGSFTAIPRCDMLELLDSVQPFLGRDGFSGIRVSTRPDAIDGEILSLLKERGVTSIELGAQSMDDAVLERNGRGHTSADVRTASELIRQAGFSLGLQMMTGLWGDTPQGTLRTAEELIALRPDTVRIYPTVVLRGTRLAELYFRNEYEPQSLREATDLCAKLLLRFQECGIRVIRLGLHASEDVEQNRLAGPYHPAFKELCEGKIYFRRALECLRREWPDGRFPSETLLAVNDRAISKMAGQRRENLIAFERFYDVKIRLTGDASVGLYDVKLVKDERGCC